MSEATEAKLREDYHLQLAAKLAAMERERAFASQNEEDLPFLYGWKWYTWAREFYDSINKINLLCAANQISKSSTQIRKAINWATNQPLWPSLWRQKPVQFWYLYPSQAVVNAECMTKWPQFLPRGERKNCPVYGWKWLKEGKDYIGIEFNSGVFLFFKTYSQKASVLQTGTCDAIFCDEELPFALFDELMMRISASDGYFHMVFTATLGQPEWRRAIEPTEEEKGNGGEFLPQAFKQTVSLYDAMTYSDGTKSHWTAEKIANVRARCGTEAEVQKRVYGRFIVIGGRVYESFDITRHMKPKHPVPASWLVYEGVDIGSGGVRDDGSKAHPSAIVFIAVSPDYRQGRVFLGWRGDGVRTTSGDVVEKHLDMKRKNNLFPVDQRYDHSAADFSLVASSMGETFNKANKAHDVGEGILNTLFKNDMLFIYEDEELWKLAGELSSLLKSTLKRNAKDDFADGLRYAAATIPWDFSWLSERDEAKKLSEEFEVEKPEETDAERQIRERRARFSDKDEDPDGIEAELEEWNDAYNG